MGEKVRPGGESPRPQRTSHRFVVVVYGNAAAADQAWPGHVVHVSAVAEPIPEVRVPFNQVERLPGVLRQLIQDASEAGPVERRIRRS